MSLPYSDGRVPERWTAGESMRVSRERLGDVLSTDDDTVIDRLLSMGLARLDGDDCVLTEPELLHGFAELREFGSPWSTCGTSTLTPKR